MTQLYVSLPPRELSSNGSHGHWTKVAKARKAYRYTVGLEAWEFRRLNAQAVRLSMVFCTKGGRKAGLYQPRDAANALSAFKSGIDGLVDAGMVPDDSSQHLELGAIRLDAKRGPYVELTVEVLR